MSICVNSFIIADTKIQGVTLRPVLGAYDLIFGLYVTINAQNEYPRVASIIGARVFIKVGTEQHQILGFARSEEPFVIKQHKHPHSMAPALILPLQPGQLAAIERLREAHDLSFELQVIGTGLDKHGDQLVQDTWRISVARSDWIKKLRDANARDILLLEVPLPLQKGSTEWMNIAKELKRAEEYFRNGDYSATVGYCRAVVQEIGHHKFKKKDWSSTLLTILANERNNMSKDEREGAIWASIRHYTHQAHHADSEGGISFYSRSEAQFILSLTASLVTHYQTG